jgi:hypothetical protein
MAQKMITQLIDDISGEVIEGNGETINFSYKGKAYTIDLSPENAKAFDKAVSTYISAASPAGRAPVAAMKTKSGAKVDRDQTQAIRDWARSHGHEVSDRGRISAKIQELYHSAH